MLSEVFVDDAAHKLVFHGRFQGHVMDSPCPEFPERSTDLLNSVISGLRPRLPWIIMADENDGAFLQLPPPHGQNLVLEHTGVIVQISLENRALWNLDQFSDHFHRAERLELRVRIASAAADQKQGRN